MCFELIKSNLRSLQNKLSLLELLTPPCQTFPPFINTYFAKTIFLFFLLSFSLSPPSYILTRLQLCCLVHRTDPLHPARITQWIFRSLYIEIYSFSRAALRIRQGMQFVSGYSRLQLQSCLNGQRWHTRRLVAALYDPIHHKVSVMLRWFCTGRIFHLPALETFCFRPGEGRIPYHSQHCT